MWSNASQLANGLKFGEDHLSYRRHGPCLFLFVRIYPSSALSSVCANLLSSSHVHTTSVVSVIFWEACATLVVSRMFRSRSCRCVSRCKSTVASASRSSQSVFVSLIFVSALVKALVFPRIMQYYDTKQYIPYNIRNILLRIVVLHNPRTYYVH